MVSRIVGGDILVCRQGVGELEDTEWEEFLAKVGTLADLERLRAIVVTDGGGPTPSQRKRMQAFFGGRDVRAAIVSDNAKVRFVVSAISLFNAGHRSFSRAELPQALKHLGATPAEAIEVSATLEQLDKLMSESPTDVRVQP